MLFGVWNFVNRSYIHVSDDTWIGSISCLLQISCVTSRSCFVLVHIYTINLTTLTLLKRMMKSKLAVMFINCRNPYLVTLKLNVSSLPFKIGATSTPSTAQRRRASVDLESLF